MSGVEVKRTNNTAITVTTQACGRLDVDHFMWFARELQKAIDAGMPMKTEVRIHDETGVNGVSITARAVLVQDIP